VELVIHGGKTQRQVAENWTSANTVLNLWKKQYLSRQPSAEINAQEQSPAQMAALIRQQHKEIEYLKRQLFRTQALHPLDPAVVNLTCHLIARQVRIDAKKYLLGLYLLLVVVFTYRFGECRLVIHIVQVAGYPAAWQYPMASTLLGVYRLADVGLSGQGWFLLSLPAGSANVRFLDEIDQAIHCFGLWNVELHWCLANVEVDLAGGHHRHTRSQRPPFRQGRLRCIP